MVRQTNKQLDVSTFCQGYDETIKETAIINRAVQCH